MTEDAAPRVLTDCAAACRVLAAHGHEDKTLGHLSWRDPEGRGFWLKRGGVGLSEVRAPDDFVLLDFDGEVLGGTGARHIEWPIHAEVLRARPELSCVFHSHPRESTAFSALDEELAPLGNEGVLFEGGVPRFTETCNLVRTPELGRSVAAALGAARALLLRNHGIVATGTSVAEVVLTAIYLESTAGLQLDLLRTGRPFHAADPDDAAEKRSITCSPAFFEAFFAHYRRLLPRARHLDHRHDDA